MTNQEYPQRRQTQKKIVKLSGVLLVERLCLPRRDQSQRIQRLARETLERTGSASSLSRSAPRTAGGSRRSVVRKPTSWVLKKQVDRLSRHRVNDLRARSVRKAQRTRKGQNLS